MSRTDEIAAHRAQRRRERVRRMWKDANRLCSLLPDARDRVEVQQLCEQAHRGDADVTAVHGLIRHRISEHDRRAA